MLKINRQYYGFICLVVLGLTTGCNAQVEPKQNTAALESKSTSAQNLQRYQIQPIADFNEPWALTELPDGRLLITEKAGKLKLFDPKTGQSLDELRDLLLKQLEVLKAGDWDENILKAIINNEK